MEELTLEELIAQAKKRKIDLGEDPEKTINHCASLGLIPKPSEKPGKNGSETTLYYPKKTLEKLAHIKDLKSKGLTLDQIKENFALMYVKNSLNDLFEDADDEKIKQLAEMIGGKEKELEAIVESPLVYLIEGMSNKEAKKLLTMFCGVGFYSMLEAQKELEKFNLNDARKALFKSIFYNSIAMLRMARTTGDKNLEETASKVYEEMVLEPISKASSIVRKEFISSLEKYLEEKGYDKVD